MVAAEDPKRLIYVPEICVLTGKHRNTIAALVKAKKWPQPVKIGRQSAWPKSVIFEFLGLSPEQERN